MSVGIDVQARDGMVVLQMASPEGDTFEGAFPPQVAQNIAANLMSAADYLVGDRMLKADDWDKWLGQVDWDHWRAHIKQCRKDLYEDFDEAEGDFLGWRYQSDDRVMSPMEFAGYAKRVNP